MKYINKKGFTLVELVIVIAVIAILAAVLIPTFTSVINRANQSSAVQKVKAAVDEAYVEYVADYHKVPTKAVLTIQNDKFVSIEFVADETVATAVDTGKKLVTLETGKYIQVNNVTGQEVYLNWATDGYQIQTTAGTEAMTAVDGTKPTT